MRKILVSLLSLTCLFSASLAIHSAQATEQSQKDWTLLVFINGNNNLDRYGTADINEMETVGSNENVNIVVQWASLANGTARRLLVTQDNDQNKVTSPVLQDVGNVDMGSWNNLVDFIRWGVTNFPAKKYFVTVWNHGSGWHMENLKAMNFRPMDISFDDNTGNAITIPQLGMAMAEAAKVIGHKVDVYGSDACLMGMAEIAYEMKDSVSTFVGAEETEPLEGWPYDQWLRQWAQQSNTSTKQVVSTLVSEFIKSYQGGTQGTEDVTLSAFDLSKLDPIATGIKNLGQNILRLNKENAKKVYKALQKTLSFDMDDYRDLGDFLKLAEQSKIASLADVIHPLTNAVQELVIANGTTDRFAKAQGVALWLPARNYAFQENEGRYSELQFQRDTDWKETLRFLLKYSSSDEEPGSGE